MTKKCSDGSNEPVQHTRVNLPRKRPNSVLCKTLFGAILVSATFFIASAIILVNHKQFQHLRTVLVQRFPELQKFDDMQVTPTDACKNPCSPDGSEALPKGIVVKTSDLELRPLWGPRKKRPALDPEKSEVHHEMTTREKGSTVHRRIERMSRSKKNCYRNSTDPPCTGWVEMMAPVFSKEAWRCVWYMIQNDLIHAWGLDMQLGYCAQGNRTQYIGIVDSEYVVHYGLPTLGGSENKTNSESSKQLSQDPVTLESNHIDIRTEVRKQSFNELETFKRRWRKAVEEDDCWVDPYNHH
ncbi:hypothetical protein R6Q59_018201 [Mikania micrantha]